MMKINKCSVESKCECCSSLFTIHLLLFWCCYPLQSPSLDIFCGNRGSSSAAGVTKYKIFSSLPPYPSPCLKYLPFSSFSSSFSPFPPLPFPLSQHFHPFPAPSLLTFPYFPSHPLLPPHSLFSPFHLEPSPILTKL